MAFRVTKKKNINVIRAGVKLISSVIGLYASGVMLTTMGDVMHNTSSPFYTGLKLIGWTVGSSEQLDGFSTNGFNSCDGTNSNVTSAVSNCITGTSGTGILAVVGLLAVVWVVFEFVDVKTG